MWSWDRKGREVRQGVIDFFAISKIETTRAIRYIYLGHFVLKADVGRALLLGVVGLHVDADLEVGSDGVMVAEVDGAHERRRQRRRPVVSRQTPAQRINADLLAGNLRAGRRRREKTPGEEINTRYDGVSCMRLKEHKIINVSFLDHPRTRMRGSLSWIINPDCPKVGEDLSNNLLNSYIHRVAAIPWSF